MSLCGRECEASSACAFAAPVLRTRYGRRRTESGGKPYARRAPRPQRVPGIDASAEPARTRERIVRTAAGTARLIGARRELTEVVTELDERYHAGTYGIPDDTTLDAMRLAAPTVGMVADPV